MRSSRLPVSPAPEPRLCPLCGTRNSDRATKCLVCGTNLALSQGIARGTHVSDVEPVLDPQPGYCCVAFVPRTNATAEAGVAAGTAETAG